MIQPILPRHRGRRYNGRQIEFESGVLNDFFDAVPRVNTDQRELTLQPIEGKMRHSRYEIGRAAASVDATRRHTGGARRPIAVHRSGKISQLAS